MNQKQIPTKEEADEAALQYTEITAKIKDLEGYAKELKEQVKHYVDHTGDKDFQYAKVQIRMGKAVFTTDKVGVKPKDLEAQIIDKLDSKYLTTSVNKKELFANLQDDKIARRLLEDVGLKVGRSKSLIIQAIAV